MRMNHSIKPGPVPPRSGLEREEPEIGQEEDIPRDDEPAAADDAGPRESEERPSRQVERE